MSSEPIIKVEGLSKKYRLHHEKQERYTTLRDTVAHRVKGLFRRGSQTESRTSTEEDFWALKDVSFEVNQGEVLGIIGRNGAGKSTLLKILSRITEPTSGRITLNGRVASLLEVGTGFHPELTGRENIFLNGAILGMTKAEIRSKFDEIVAFAEVEKFLDTPVKRYSSGMYVRLAFAVAAHLEPEILVVDEVLAVGDSEFQKKCLGKIGEVAKGGRTVLFVSHNMAAVQSLCSNAILLGSGAIQLLGTVDHVIDKYLRNSKAIESISRSNPLFIDDRLELTSFVISPEYICSAGDVTFSIELHAKAKVCLSDLSILIYSQSGVRVAILDFRGRGIPATIKDFETVTISGTITELNLVEGDYSFGVYLSSDTVSGNFFDLASLGVSPDRSNETTPTYPPAHRGILELKFRITKNRTEL